MCNDSQTIPTDNLVRLEHVLEHVPYLISGSRTFNMRRPLSVKYAILA